MRRIKKVSITKYIISYLIGLILALSFLMVIFVSILADRMIYYDIQSVLLREIIKNNKNTSYEDGIIKPNEDFRYVDDGMYFRILDEDGLVILGESPIKVEFTEEGLSQRLRMVESEGEEYYIIGRINKRMTKEVGHIIYNQCIVNKRDVESKYKFIKYTSYASIPVFLMLVLMAGLVMSGKISGPLKQMSKTAEIIGQEGELSRRIEYDGKIKELGVLAATNNRMLERIENMLEMQKQFSSDVAHELRTPIAVLLAQCEYAKEYVSTKEEFDDAIDVIYRQTKKTNMVITQLLNLNRLESERVVLDLEDADLDEMIRSICDEIEFKEKDDVQFELALSGVRADMDIGLMLILLQNLIQNAVKYSARPARVKIATQYRDDAVVVKVQDFGCGIREEDLPHIFDPFFRVEKARNSEGFGLGLPLADRIAKAHKGEIKVDSVWGKGSTFTLVINGK
ncbi:MAG: HAMP domain-containing histidine kinase [Dorea sp.]|nr:HAMP domain-containing histidine kinase [Dorea sp.]